MSLSKLRSGTRGRIVGLLRGLLAAPPALATVRQRALHIITSSVLPNAYVAHAVLHLHTQELHWVSPAGMFVEQHGRQACCEYSQFQQNLDIRQELIFEAVRSGDHAVHLGICVSHLHQSSRD